MIELPSYIILRIIWSKGLGNLNADLMPFSKSKVSLSPKEDPKIAAGSMI